MNLSNKIQTFTHRTSSPLVTVLRRRVLNPAGSIPLNPPMLGPKNVSNKSKGLVCKKKKKKKKRTVKSVISFYTNLLSEYKNIKLEKQFKRVLLGFNRKNKLSRENMRHHNNETFKANSSPIS